MIGFRVPDDVLDPNFTGEGYYTQQLLDFLRSLQADVREHEDTGEWIEYFDEDGGEWIEYYNADEELTQLENAEQRLKEILATREHVPNKQERKEARLKKMHERQNR